MEEPGFWDEPEESQKIMKNLKDLKDQVETVEHLEQSYEDIGLLIEMAYEEEDESVLPEIEEELNAFEEDLTIFRAIEREDCTVKDKEAFVNGQLTIKDATVTGV